MCDYKKSYSVRRTITKERAFNRLLSQCSKSEKCVYDAEMMLKKWGIEDTDAKEIIGYLIENKYIDNVRYVEAYVRDKLSFNGWGRLKIFQMLKLKKIDETTIKDALSQIDNDELEDNTYNILNKKAKSIKYKDKNDFKNKLLRFAAYRGFEYSLANSLIEKIYNQIRGDE